MNRKTDLYSRNLRLARTTFGVGEQQILLKLLEHLSAMHFDIGSGDLALLNNHWYVTHTGLLSPKPLPRGLILCRTNFCASRSCAATDGGVNPVARCRILRSTTGSSAAIREPIQKKT